MTDSVRSNRESDPTARPPSARQSSKARRQEAMREAARRRAAARLRKRLVFGGIGAVIALALAFGVFKACEKPAGKPASNTANTSLTSKPVVAAGTGEVTKLAVTTLVEGSGAPVASGQTIKVNYVGVLYKTGAEFDSSWKSGQPASFQIGVGGVIPGWDQGLVGVKVGSRVQLDIPADLAYGDNPGGGRPGGPLRFVVDILEAK